MVLRKFAERQSIGVLPASVTTIPCVRLKDAHKCSRLYSVVTVTASTADVPDLPDLLPSRSVPQENFLTVLDPQHLDIESSDVAASSTLSRVSK